MKPKQRLSVAAGLLVAVLVGVSAIGLTFPATAAPPGQEMLPTPTVFPVDTETIYTLEIVGGKDETLSFTHEDSGPFTLGETQVRSLYPRGMHFMIDPSSSNGEIQEATLFMTSATGLRTRIPADWDAEKQMWVAHPWDTGEGQPAWMHFTWYWRIRDMGGEFVDTEVYEMDYWDPNREWFRMEIPEYVVYWWGLSDEDPDRFAAAVAEALASTEPRRVAGFGRPISYRPVATIYGNRAAWDETFAAGISDPTAGGQTSFGTGMSVQFVPGRDAGRDIVWLSHVLTHELTHMYQFDVLGGLGGPVWWYEGQAEWFGYSPGVYDDRVFLLAAIQDMPSLSTPVGNELIQADGRRDLGYFVGASFVNWFVANYGIETHQKLVGLMTEQTPFYEAIEMVTDTTFLDLENGWRAYIGAAPLTLADIDPAAALEPYEDNMFAVGDVVTLPASPVMVNMYGSPGPNVLISGSCFANTQVTIKQIGALDGVPYFQVDCMGQVGWLGRDQLLSPE